MARTVSVQPTGHVLSITLTGGTASHQVFVRVINRRTGDFREIKASSNSASVDAGDLSDDGSSSGSFSGFVNGDILEIRGHGQRMGSGTHTIDSAARKGGGKVTVTVADVTATNVPEANI